MSMAIENRGSVSSHALEKRSVHEEQEVVVLVGSQGSVVHKQHVTDTVEDFVGLGLGPQSRNAVEMAV